MSVGGEVGREKGGKFKKTYMYTYLMYIYPSHFPNDDD